MKPKPDNSHLTNIGVFLNFVYHINKTLGVGIPSCYPILCFWGFKIHLSFAPLNLACGLCPLGHEIAALPVSIIFLVKAGRRQVKGKRSIHAVSSFKKKNSFPRRIQPGLPFMFHWLELGHMATPSSIGVAMCPSSHVKVCNQTHAITLKLEFCP